MEETGFDRFVWSPPKHLEIRNAIRNAFRIDHREGNRESICKLIVGCPGSGKTVIQLCACEEYCNKWQNANALFIVPTRNTRLRQQLESYLERSGWGERIEIRSEVPSAGELALRNIGFIACDELYEEEFLNESSMSRSMLNALESGIHILIATMEKDYKSIEGFTLRNIRQSNHFYEAYMLGGANHRSDKAILKLVHETQEIDIEEEKDTVPINLNDSSMNFSVDAVHLKYMKRNGLGDLGTDEANTIGDNDPFRTDFINACFDYIIEKKSLLDEGKEVLIYNICHFSLFLRIKKKLEDESSVAGGLLTDVQFRNLVFEDTRACQGAEYDYSFGVFDHTSLPYKPYKAITSALTRTIKSAHLLINIAEDPPYRLDTLGSTPELPKRCILFDLIDGESNLSGILSNLREDKPNLKVLFSEGDNSINREQIEEGITMISVPNFPFKKDVRFETWNDVDVVIGSPKFYANYQHAWSPIHSCDAFFIITYRKDENEERIKADDFETNNCNNQRINKLTKDLLVHRFKQVLA